MLLAKLVYLIIIIISILVHPLVSVPTMCVTGTFTDGSRAFVTCLFNVDVKVSKRNFNVVRYAKSISGDSESVQKTPDHVLLCNWANEEPVCETAAGFSFNKHEVSDQLVLGIPTVSRDKEGLYACQMVPDDVQISTCTLYVEDKQISDNTSQHHTKHEVGNSPNNGYLAWAIVMTLLLLLAVVAVVFIACSRRYRKTHSEGRSHWAHFVPCCHDRLIKLLTVKADSPIVETACEATHRENLYAVDEETNRPLMTEAIEHIPLTDDTDASSHVPAIAASDVTPTGRTIGSQTQKVSGQNKCIQACVHTDTQITQTQKQVTLVETWDARDIRDWLQEVSIERYQPLLAMNMTGEKLLTLNHISELKTMGIEGEDAKRLKDKIYNLIMFNQQISKAQAEAVLPRAKQRTHVAVVSSL